MGESFDARNVAAGVLSVAERFGRTLAPGVAGQVAAFVELLLRWNARINLTGARSADELLEQHLPDSFALADLVGPAARVVDVGSGGGLPALPFALLRPDVSLTLVEPRAKRVAFLRTAMRELAVSGTLVSDRIDAVTGPFDVAASRATFPPPEWLRVGRRLVGPGGNLVFFLHTDGEIPFDPAESHATVRYRAGSQERVAVGLKVSGSL